MRDSATQAERTEIAQIDAAVGKRFMEFNQHRFVFRSYGADRNLIPIAHGPIGNILQGVGTDRGLRQLIEGDVGRRVKRCGRRGRAGGPGMPAED